MENTINKELLSVTDEQLDAIIIFVASILRDPNSDRAKIEQMRHVAQSTWPKEFYMRYGNRVCGELGKGKGFWVDPSDAIIAAFCEV